MGVSETLIIDSQVIHVSRQVGGIPWHMALASLFIQKPSMSSAIQAPKVRAGGHAVGHFVHPGLEMLRHPLHIAVQQQKEPGRCHYAPASGETYNSKKTQNQIPEENG